MTLYANRETGVVVKVEKITKNATRAKVMHYRFTGSAFVNQEIASEFRRKFWKVSSVPAPLKYIPLEPISAIK